ncbi:hypothetical protein V6N11_032295 [Hibiscus sabdariffa]|uniref:RRM domain-containing protein n=1 Tax=Hibiscus sabdariffa TaxID=183260 RepID=A0ABR2T0R0_9ROSI
MARPPYEFDPYFLQPDQDRNLINTLFVSGLPDDVKAREIHNLFRRRAGFDYCQLKYTGRGNQGVKFDPQAGSVLHIELARSNSRRKQKPGSGPYVVIDNRTKASANNTQETSSDNGDSDPEEPSGADNADSSNNDELQTLKSDTVLDPEHSVPAANEQLERTVNEGAQPCSTLFIANLGPNCTEYELKEVLSKYPGFNLLKIRVKGGMPVAFADFEQIEQATKVLTELQSSLLPSSDRGGMHIEYAKSRMRKH